MMFLCNKYFCTYQCCQANTKTKFLSSKYSIYTIYWVIALTSHELSCGAYPSQIRIEMLTAKTSSTVYIINRFVYKEKIFFHPCCSSIFSVT
jgi:hypothetical protein